MGYGGPSRRCNCDGYGSDTLKSGIGLVCFLLGVVKTREGRKVESEPINQFRP